MSFSVHIVDLCLPQAPRGGPHTVARRFVFLLAPLHQPNASRVAESNAHAFTPTLASSCSISPAWSKTSPRPSRRHRETRGRREHGANAGATEGSDSRGRGDRGASAVATAGSNSRGRGYRGISTGATAVGNSRERGDRGASPGATAGSNSRGRGDRGASAGATAGSNGRAAADAGERCFPAWAACPHVAAGPSSEPEANVWRAVSAENISSNVLRQHDSATIKQK